jgi:D-amino peptidase
LGYSRALQEVRNILEGVFAALGDTPPFRLVINDAHASMTNLFLAGINWPNYVSLISGKPKVFGMMAGLKPEMRGVILMGYHGKAGTLNAALAHSFTDDIADICLNGISLGEAGLSILLAHYGMGVPVLGTYGDDALHRELQPLLGNTPFWTSVISKESLGWQTIHTRPNAQTDLNTLFQSLQQATNYPIPPLPACLPESMPWELTLRTHFPLVADAISLLPHTLRVNGTTLQLPLHVPVTASLSERVKDLYSTVQCAYSLGLYAKFC